MEVININGTTMVYPDEGVPEIYKGKTIHFDDLPELPDHQNRYDLILQDEYLLWVLHEMSMEEKLEKLEEEKAGKDDLDAMWTQMADAVREGVNEV